jgi:hypothetical protein
MHKKGIGNYKIRSVYKVIASLHHSGHLRKFGGRGFGQGGISYELIGKFNEGERPIMVNPYR